MADAVLYEGYLLYPYRASAAKNQARWQFGVLMPRRWSEDGPEEPWSTQTECLLEPEDATTVRVLVRFLHVQAKTVEVVDVEAGTFNEVPALPVDGSELVPWDEATEQEVTVEALLARLLAGELVTPFERPAGAGSSPSTPRPASWPGGRSGAAGRSWGGQAVGRAPGGALRPGPPAAGGRERQRLARPGPTGASPCGTRWSPPTASSGSTRGCSCPCSTRRSGPSRPPRPARTSTPGRC